MSGNRDQDGSFSIRDVVPGNYRLVVRPVMYGPQPPPQPSTTPREYANIPLTVASDIDDLVIVTQPGASVTGRVVFAEGAPPEPLTNLRVTTQPVERNAMYGPPPNATVGADMQFKLGDLFEPQLVRITGLGSRYAVKAITLGQTDISETGADFKTAQGRLEIVLTSRVSTLEGTVTDDTGESSPNVMIMMFPEDKTSWKMTSPRIRFSGGLKEGKFRIGSILPGRYYVVAWPRDRASFGDAATTEYFEMLAKEATAVVIGEDEQRTIDLRVAKDPRER
jgi:hypothetical protein